MRLFVYQHKHLTSVFSPGNIITAHAEMNLDSEQLTPGVLKNPEETKKKKMVLMALSSGVLQL